MTAVSAVTAAAIVDGPYVGLNFYTQEKADLFFGRDSEQTVLISNLRASRLTLLYAKSGTGKSSLLRAGVEAKLMELAQRNVSQRGTARNVPVVFSSWRDDPTAELIGEISRAISPFRSGAPSTASGPDRLAAAIQAANQATGATLLVILDQFEEYLLYRSREAGERPFADELAACVNRADLRADFLISIREDAYFALGDLFKGRIGNVYGNYFHLEHLTREAARDAIEKPVASFNELHPEEAPVLIEPGLVEAVLDQFRPDQLAPDRGGSGRLAGQNGADPYRDEVEASYLQLVMKRLWDVERGKGSRVLRLETLEELGGAQTIMRTHVDRALEGLPDGEREAAVAILHHLVTPSRTKIALAASDLAEYTGHPAAETSALLERLAASDTRILRPVPPPPGQAAGTRFEISHDLLAPAILDWDRQHKAIRLEREKEAAEWQARAENVRARRFRTTAIIASVVAALLVVVTLVAVLAQKRANDAVLQSHVAQSEGMAAEAVNLLSTDSPLAMLLSLRAFETFPTIEAESALIQAVQQPLDKRLALGGPVDNVAFSPDGRILAVSGDSSGVTLWDTATGHRIATIDQGAVPGGQLNNISSYLGNLAARLAFSPDGRTLAIGGDEGVSLWDVTTRQRIATLAVSGPIEGMAFSPGGRTLGVYSFVDGVGLWDLATGKQTASPFGPGSLGTLPTFGAFTGLAFSPDGQTLAAASFDGVRLWDMVSGRITSLPLLSAVGGASDNGIVGPVDSVAFSRDGRTLATGDYAGHIILWNLATRKQTAAFSESGLVGSIAFSPDGRILATSDYAGRIGLWNTATGQRIATLPQGNTVVGIAFSPDGRTLTASDFGGGVDLWDLAIAQRPTTLAAGSSLTSMAFSPNGRTVAAGDHSGHVSEWNAATGQRTARLADGSSVASVAFSPGGQMLAVGDSTGHVSEWDASTGKRTATLTAEGSVASVAFSPDGHFLAAGDSSGHVSVWNTSTGRQTATLSEGHPVTSVAFSPDGHSLAAGDNQGNTGVWDAATWQQTSTLTEDGQVASVAFSPDGSALVTGDSLGTVVIWNAASGQALAQLTEQSAVSSLAFSPSHQVLAIGGLNGNIALLWQNLADLTQRYFTQVVCGRVRGNMTQAQWAQYAPDQPYQKTCP